MFISSLPGVLLTLTLLLSGVIQGVQAEPTGPSSPQITPQLVTSGKQHRIHVTLPSTSPPRQFYLSPGGPEMKRRWDIPHPGRDLVWADDLLYIAAGNGGLLIVDSKNKEQPLLARLSVGDFVSGVRYSHEHAWLAARGGLYTVDVSHPDAPFARAFINTAHAVTALATSERSAALAQGHEIQMFDSRQPGLLRPRTSLQLEADINALAIDHQYLYVAAGSEGVFRYRIGAGQQLTAAGHYHTSGPAIDIKVGDHIAAVATRNLGLTLLDASDTHDLRWLGSHQQVGDIQHLQLDKIRHQVMLLNRQHQVLLIDISKPAMPSMVSAVQLDDAGSALALRDRTAMIAVDQQIQEMGFSANPPQYSNEGLDFGQGVNYGGERRVFIRDNIAYVADWFSGIHLYDISTPQQPQLLSSFHTQGSPKGIVVRDDYAYVADDDHGLQIINIHNPRQPYKVSELLTPGLAYMPELDGDRLYLAAHRGGFHIIDISDPEHPQLLGSYDTAGKTWAIRIRDNIAYIADDDSGLMMFDISQPDNIHLVGQFSPGGNAEDVILDHNIAYVTFFDRGLYVIDIGDPGYPKKIAHLQTPGNARGLVLDGRILYIADWLSGIQVIDVSTPSQPQLIGSYDTAGAAWGLALKDQHAFVMDWWGGFCVLDISQPSAPKLAGHYHNRDHIQAISTRDKVAYAASGTAGLQIYDIKNPLNPTWMTGVDFDAAATRVVTSDRRAYVALADRHIAVVDISNPYAAYQVKEFRSRYPVIDLRMSGPWLVLNHGSKGMTLYRIDGKYADKPRRQRRIKTPINSIAFSGDQGLALAQTDGLISIYAQAGDKKPQKQFRQAATLLRHIDNYLISYTNNDGITILDGDGKRIDHLEPDQAIIDMQVYDSILAVIDERQQLTLIDLGTINKPVFKARYKTLSPLTRITTDDGTLYFSGNTSITALRPLPATPWKADADDHGSYDLTIAADMPDGSYTMHIDDLKIDNAITVQAPKFSRPKFTMDDLNKALKKMRQPAQ